MRTSARVAEPLESVALMVTGTLDAGISGSTTAHVPPVTCAVIRANKKHFKKKKKKKKKERKRRKKEGERQEE